MKIEHHEKLLGVLSKFRYGALVFSIMAFISSFMAFDAPNSEKLPWPYLYVLITFAVCVSPFITPKYVNFALAAGKIPKAYMISLIPFVSFLFFIFGLLVMQI